MPALTTIVPSPAMVGLRKISLRGSESPKVLFILVITCVAWREWPPRAKKLSWMPTFSRPVTSLQMAARASSVSLEGGVYSPAPVRSPGSGSALRSSFPLDVRGSEGIVVNVEGIIYPGRIPWRNVLISAPVSPGAAGTT